jgi:hypothetical protein
MVRSHARDSFIIARPSQLHPPPEGVAPTNPPQLLTSIRSSHGSDGAKPLSRQLSAAFRRLLRMATTPVGATVLGAIVGLAVALALTIAQVFGLA